MFAALLFFIVLITQIVLIILKLAGLVTIGWLAVLGPTLGYIALQIICSGTLSILEGVEENKKLKKILKGFEEENK